MVLFLCFCIVFSFYVFRLSLFFFYCIGSMFTLLNFFHISRFVLCIDNPKIQICSDNVSDKSGFWDFGIFYIEDKHRKDPNISKEYNKKTKNECKNTKSIKNAKKQTSKTKCKSAKIDFGDFVHSRYVYSPFLTVYKRAIIQIYMPLTEFQFCLNYLSSLFKEPIRY